MTTNIVCHKGGCHCGAVRFEAYAPAKLHVYQCNCSICVKKQNLHFIVPASKFKLLQGSENLTTYTFNTHKAKHMFCKTCGVQSFYIPRSNPDGYDATSYDKKEYKAGVCPHCLDPGTVESTETEVFNGDNWESHIGTTDIHKWSSDDKS